MNNTPGLHGPVTNTYSARMSGAMSGNHSPAYSPAIGIMPPGQVGGGSGYGAYSMTSPNYSPNMTKFG